MKKIYSFGLLAAAMMIAPTAAFANQTSQQELNQNASAVGYSQVNQQANQVNLQQQYRQGHHYSCGWSPQSQHSTQVVNQNGAAIDGSRVDQHADQSNRQIQFRHCY
ncbi:MAG: hypothetical protein PUP92_03510 [Rhizonema sp. PD38]|nr:hypothetical protein [Rhizonema sp. PD38]